MRYDNFMKSISVLSVCVLIISMGLMGCVSDTQSRPNPLNPTPTPVYEEIETGDIAPFPPDPHVKKVGSITATVWDFQKCPTEYGEMVNNPWTKWINQNCPVNVKFVPVSFNEESTILRSRFASGTAPDYVLVYDQTLRQSLFKEKKTMRLNELVEEHSIEYKKVIQPFMKQVTSVATTLEGDMFAFVRVEEPSIGTTHATIRSDWLEKLNMKMPETLDDFYEAAKAFATRDPDGNGKADTYGFNLSDPGSFYLEGCFGIGEVGTRRWRPYIIENDKLILPWDRVKEYVGFMKKLFEAGVIDKDFILDKDSTKATQDFLQGKLGIAVLNSASAYTDKQICETFHKNNPTGKAAPLGLLKTKFGAFKLGVSNNVGAIAVVNADAKDPVAVMKYQDFVSTKEVAKVMRLGIEGRHYKPRPGGRGVITLNPELTKRERDMIIPEFRHNIHGYLVPQECSPLFSLDIKQPVDRHIYQYYYEQYKLAGNEQNMLAQPYPSLPRDLVVKENSIMKKVRNLIWDCVTIKSYSVDKFFKDAQNVWYGGGGKEVEQYYADWYDKYKDRIITAEFANKNKMPVLPSIEELDEE